MNTKVWLSVLSSLAIMAGLVSPLMAEETTEVEIKDIKLKMPKSWKGESHSGKKLSECPSDFLDIFAAALEFKATKEEEDPDRRKWAAKSRLEAAKARAWAKRKRSNGETATTSSGDGGFVD